MKRFKNIIYLCLYQEYLSVLLTNFIIFLQFNESNTEDYKKSIEKLSKLVTVNKSECMNGNNFLLFST